jgi:hypothetical protein
LDEEEACHGLKDEEFEEWMKIDDDVSYYGELSDEDIFTSVIPHFDTDKIHEEEMFVRDVQKLSHYEGQAAFLEILEVLKLQTKSWKK